MNSKMIRELREETGLTFTPVEAPAGYQKPAFTSIGMSDEARCYGIWLGASGTVSRDMLEDNEELEIVCM